MGGGTGGAPEREKVFPAEERRALQEVLDHYGLTLRGIDRRGGQLLTDRGPYQLRRFGGTPEELAFIAGALRHLEENGFSWCRRLRPTEQGEPGVSHGSSLLYLVEGERGRRFDPGRRSEAHQAAALLAAFHQAGEGLPLPEHGVRTRLDRWPGVLQERHSELQLFRREAAHSRGDFARLYAEYADDFLEQSDRALTGLLAAPLDDLLADCAARRRLAHRRFSSHHLRRVGQEIIIDGWDHLGVDLPVIDLARYLPGASAYDPDRAYAALEAYHETEPLREAEWEVLLAWLRFPHAFWRLGHLHFRRGETHRSRLSRVTRSEIEREVFIETLALQWAARQLTPAGFSRPAGRNETPAPAGAEPEDEKREETPVSESEELLVEVILSDELPASTPAPEQATGMMTEPGPEMTLEPGPEVTPEPGPAFRPIPEGELPVSVEDVALPAFPDLEFFFETPPAPAPEPAVDMMTEPGPEMITEPSLEATPSVPPDLAPEPGPALRPVPELAVPPETTVAPKPQPGPRVLIWKSFPMP
ncbi:MAG: hypothetical protein ACM3RP_06640 [Chitinophagales bacterium]